MKRKLQNVCAGSLLLICTISAAQPTITATGCNPVVGDVTNFAISSTTFAPGSAGASQTWNFAANTGTAGTPSTGVTVASTPYSASFPNANIAFSSGSSYSYEKATSTALQNYGNANSTVTTVYSNPEDLMHFPFTYTNTFNDAFVASYVSSTITFYRTGHDTVTADGYGTLTTPSGTYTNVLRCHLIENYQDSSYISGTPFVNTFRNDEYSWFKDGMHQALAFTSSYDESGNMGSFSGYIPTGLGIDEIAGFNNNYNIYPVPASAEIKLNFNLSENKTVVVRVYNTLGEQVEAEQAKGGVQGDNQIELNVATLPEGIYFAQIVLEGNVAGTKRFIVSK